MATPRNGARAPLAVLAVGVLAVSWAAIFVRLADEAPALTIAAYRLLFAAGLLVLVAAAAKALGRSALPPRQSWPLLALSGVLLAGHFWSWFASLERTSVGSSVVIVGMQPLLGALLAFLVLREQPARGEYAGVALALGGLVVIAAADLGRGAGEFAGDLLALLAAFLVAGYQTVRRRTRHEVDALAYSAVVYTVAAIALWVAVLVVRPSLTGFGGEAWTFILLLALIPQVIGHTALNWALGHLRVVTVGLAVLGEPVIATLLAIPVLGETPPVGVLIGGPLVVAGVALGLRSAARAGDGEVR